MSKYLINLIKKSKFVIITGPIGSGKSLLLTKLAHHPQLTGSIITSEKQLTSLSLKENVFIDEGNSLLVLQYYQQIINYQQRLILSGCRFLFTSIKIRDQVDLIIRTKGIKKRWWFGWEKYLQLEISHNSLNYYNRETINLPLTEQDLIRLDIYCNNQREEYHKTRKSLELDNVITN